MTWIIIVILSLVVFLLLVRDRNMRARLPKETNSLLLESAPFFQFQCEFGETQIKQGRGIVAMVMSMLGEAADIVPEARTENTAYATIVRIASSKGGFTTAAISYGEEAQHLKLGDIVICVPVAFREHLASKSGDPKQGWLWELRAQIDPFADPADGFKVLQRFGPAQSNKLAE